MSDLFDSWKEREPWVVQDPDFKREWLCLEPFRFYMHYDSNPTTVGWVVIDRWSDFAVTTRCRTRNDAIRAFYKTEGRGIPSGTVIGKFEDSNFTT